MMTPFEATATGTAKYQQLADWFAARIRSGELSPGDEVEIITAQGGAKAKITEVF